jgi:hypothetical protein
MPKETEAEVARLKARVKLDVNLWLLAITFTIFTFIVSLNPMFVLSNAFLSLQLTLAIPLLSSSIFARNRQSYGGKSTLWEIYGFLTFLLAYSFLINVIGILLATLISLNTAAIFWGANIASALIYSSLEVLEGESTLWSRMWKDGLFISIIFGGGLIPLV